MGLGEEEEAALIRLMLIADKSLCALRDQDKDVKKLFPRKKISSFTSPALDVAKKPH